MHGHAVLVTGAARGIGKEVARRLAERGAIVLVSVRDAGRARTAAADLGAVGDVRALGVDLDVADDASVAAAVQALEAPAVTSVPTTVGCCPSTAATAEPVTLVGFSGPAGERRFLVRARVRPLLKIGWSAPSI